MANKNTLFVGKVSLAFDVLPSTNAYALDLIAKSAPKEGTVISASFQSEGRGQIGSRWDSPAGNNLLMSTILYPTFLPASQQFLLSQAVSLAVMEVVKEYTSGEVKVKWPNDVYLQGRKVAGILLQVALSGQRLQSCVAGIGLNVNQTDFPAWLGRATSMALETGRRVELEALKAALCYRLESRYLQLRAGNYQQVRSDYMDALLGYQQSGLYRRPEGEAFLGEIVGINESGQLLLRHNEKTEAFQLKEISLVRLL